MTDLIEQIRKKMVEALAQYQMLSANDRVLVAVSGGKDSAVLLALLEQIRIRAPFVFSIEAVMVDQKQPGFDAREFAEWVKSLGIKFTLIEEDTYSIVKEKTPVGKAFCSLCSRLRRGILYSFAVNHGFTKIALGHHREDLNETLLLNLFYSGSLASMPPKLWSDDGKNIVIRPLSFVPENWIASAAKTLKVPIIPCKLCGSQEGLKREKIKKLIQALECENPNIANIMLNAQKNVRPSQLSDEKMWNHVLHITEPAENLSKDNFLRQQTCLSHRDTTRLLGDT